MSGQLTLRFDVAHRVTSCCSAVSSACRVWIRCLTSASLRSPIALAAPQAWPSSSDKSVWTSSSEKPSDCERLMNRRRVRGPRWVATNSTDGTLWQRQQLAPLVVPHRLDVDTCRCRQLADSHWFHCGLDSVLGYVPRLPLNTLAKDFPCRHAGQLPVPFWQSPPPRSARPPVVPGRSCS